MTSRPRRIALVAAAALIAGPAVAATAACSSSSPAPVVAATSLPANNASVDSATFASDIANTSVVLLDVRTPSEFTTGHIAGAKNIDVEGADFAQQIMALDRNATYAVYCHSGNRSAVAKQAMENVGFTHVFDLQGGITAWQSAGYPVTQG